MERRKSRRVRCQLACEIHAARDQGVGTVLDMSEGGLAVRTPLEADQGDALRVRIEAPGGPLELEAIVWHSRLVRSRGSEDRSWALGLMIAKAPDAYFHIVPRDAPRDAMEPESDAPDLADAAAAIAADECSDGLVFRIRVKQLAGPRTRILSLNAESEDEARALASAELKDEWEILETWAA